MLKEMLVTVKIVVAENVDNADIEQNIEDLNYVSEEPVEFVEAEFVGWRK